MFTADTLCVAQVARTLDMEAINRATTIGEFDELYIARVRIGHTHVIHT